MTHGSLFSGIGGFDLAAEWMGWENKFHCEWNPFGQKILKHYWPDAETFTDITKTDFTKYANKIDILTGGFPCQPYSAAGRRLGKDDERHLWPEMLRAIREINPTYIVGENVRGLLNWNGGMVFHEVCAELEANGYEVAPCLIPACGVGAPHRRERIWFVAYSNSRGGCRKEGIGEYDLRGSERKEQNNYIEPTDKGLEQRDKNRNVTHTELNGKKQDGGTIEKEAGEIWGQKESDVFRGCDKNGDATYSNTPRIFKQYITSESNKKKKFSRSSFERRGFASFPTQSPICGGNDGLPTELDGIAFSKWRNESIKGYGNAIVPQVALQIFKAIQKYDTENRCKP